MWILSLMAFLIWYSCTHMQHSVRNRQSPVRKQQMREYMQMRKQQLRQASSVGMTVRRLYPLLLLIWQTDRMISTAVPMDAITKERAKPHLTNEQVWWTMRKITIMLIMYRWITTKQMKRNLDDLIKCSCSDIVRWLKKNNEVSVIPITTPVAIWTQDIIIIITTPFSQPFLLLPYPSHTKYPNDLLAVELLMVSLVIQLVTVVGKYGDIGMGESDK